jgi:membrane peptidoglycan carboxypeptidase
MQTSLARRQRRRRNGDQRRRSGGGTVKAVAIALPLFLFGTFVLVGVTGLVGSVAAYNAYAEGLPDPKEVLADFELAQQTTIYDREGEVELARLGDFRREVVAFSDIPDEVIDATTAIEDKTFWENAGFDPLGIASAAIDTIRGRERGASTITQQLVRNTRLLPPDAFEGSVYERKIREIIQSVRLTQAFPGDEGKKTIMEAYLNLNFYGNQSYGVKSAAEGYFGKDLEELTLAEAAILAAIPKSPTTYDLVRNAQQTCLVEVEEGAACPADKTQLVVPADTEIVQRRNYILDLMKTRSVLSGDRHTPDEYERAKDDAVVLIPQRTLPWKAAHFVWQVQRELDALLCGPEAESCDIVATGGLQVITTLDWAKQQTVEKWLYLAARAPNLRNTGGILERYKVAAVDRAWINELRTRNIHNAAAAIEDARTGEILAYAGSAGYDQPGTDEFQPQFDVLSLGYRQPGSAIKPIHYAIGIDDRTMTAATMFTDVVTDFGGSTPYTPKQADDLERGPVRLRSALQFSLNIPAIKSGFINGLDHQFTRSQEFGLTYLKGAVPVVSMGIGTLETRPVDLLGAYATIANGGVRMPQQMILEIRDANGQVIWPVEAAEPEGEAVISPQAAYIVSDILKGNTDRSVNPYWAEWAIVDGGKRREAAYKTGTTEDNVDVAAYGYLAPPADPDEPQLVVGVWMGNSNNEPNKGSLSLDSSAPLWSRILAEASRGTPFAGFAASRPAGIVEAKVDANSGMLPGPFTSKTITELFIADTVKGLKVDTTKRAVEIDEATGDLWAEGCTGPMITKGFLDLSSWDARYPKWQQATNGWVARAAKGIGVVGGPMKTKTTFFYNGGFAPFGRGWGAPFAPTETCVPVVWPTCDPLASPGPLESGAPTPTPCVSPSPSPSPEPSPSATPRPSKTPKPSPSPEPSPSPSPTPSKTPKPSPSPTG